MTKLRTYAFFTLILLACSAPAEGLRLLPGVDDGFVRLAWTAASWPENLSGYAVKRRPVGSTQWQDISTVKVEISTTADWTAREPDASRHQALIDKLQNFIDQGVKPMDTTTMVAALHAEPDYLSAYYLQGLRDVDMPLLTGVGCVDRGVATDKAWEYGVFAVATDNTIAEKPSAVVRTPQFGSTVAWEFDDEVEGDDTSATLSWNPNVKRAATYGVVGYLVQEHQADGSWKNLLNNPICDPFHQNADDRGFWIVDGNPGDTKFYRIAAVNYFGGIVAEVIIPYEYRKTAPYIAQRPDNLQSMITEDGKVNLSWDFAAADQANISGFIVRRISADTGTESDASKLLPVTARSFLDTTVTPGTYFYSVVATDDKIGNRSSDALTIEVKSTAKPNPPTELTYTLKPADDCYGDPNDPTSGFWCTGAWQLSLNWQAPKASPVPLQGYQLSADRFTEGELSLVNGAPLEATEYSRGLGQDGRNYSWQVTSIGEDGSKSTPATVTFFVPSGRLPNLMTNDIRAVSNGTNTIITWKYPQLPDLAGFRIYGSQTPKPQLLVDETKLTSKVREWSIPSPAPDKRGNIYFRMQAISKYNGIRTKQTSAIKQQ